MGSIKTTRSASSDDSRLSTAKNTGRTADWLLDTGQLLEEKHLVAWSRSVNDRNLFGTRLAAHLFDMRDTQVHQFHGSSITDKYSFCSQLERAIENDHIKRVIEGPNGIVDALRESLETASIKRRFFVWHDAHVMLRADPKAFARLVDALAGVCAESEYVSEDRLVIQRLIFIGAPSLDLYAEDARGQFCAWYSEQGEKPLWQCITGLKRPPFLRYAIDSSVLRDEPAVDPVIARSLRPAPKPR